MALSEIKINTQTGETKDEPQTNGSFKIRQIIIKLMEYTHTHRRRRSEVAQSSPSVCDPMDCSPPGSSIHGILQARILGWVAISSSRGSSPPRDWTQVSRIVGRCFTLWATREAKVKVKSLSRVWLFATRWTAAHQALSMGFSRQEYWNGLPFPSPGDLPNPGIEPRSPALQADALTSEPPGKPVRDGYNH